MYFDYSFFKITCMKNNKLQAPAHNTRLNNNKHRPENKDDIDSREGEEQLMKGDDRTHNRKERKSLKKRTGR
jgi:hypothetical protein